MVNMPIYRQEPLNHIHQVMVGEDNLLSGILEFAGKKLRGN
jgi:hypothetical protein